MSNKSRSVNADARRKAKRRSKTVTWIAVLLVGAAAVYGLSQFSPIGFDEDDIKAVNFSSLSDKQKRVALTDANTARCTCGCGMNLAQCVSTDMTCPVRDANIEKIKGMVREAQTGPES
jgi:hypothetical protein